MNYDVDYFIKKFEAIPEEKIRGDRWWDKELKCGCAHGHCGVRYDAGETEESAALLKIIPFASCITAGTHPHYYFGTPKQRILAALYDIKKMQQPEWNDITTDLAKLPVEETSDLTIKTNQPCNLPTLYSQS